MDDGPSRPHRRLFIAIGALLVISAVVIACVILLTREDPVTERSEPSATQPLPLTNGSVISLSEVLSMRFSADSFAGEWISGE